MSEWEPSIDTFIDHLIVEEGRAPRTATAYRQDLRSFAAWARSEGRPSPKRVDREDLLAYQAVRQEAGDSPRTRARALVSLRKFFRHQVARGALREDPSRDLEAPRLPRKLPSVLGAEEISALAREILKMA